MPVKEGRVRIINRTGAVKVKATVTTSELLINTHEFAVAVPAKASGQD